MGQVTLYNIFVIKNLKNGHQYIDYTELQLQKKWKEILQKYNDENSALFMSLRYYGISNFKISVLEEHYGLDIEDRMEYWFNRYNPELNQDIIIPDNIQQKKSNSKLKWGYQRTKKPSPKHESNIIKCRNLETGKLKTLHGWKAAADYVNGNITNIKKAIRRKGTAYGYKWWIYKRAKDPKRKVYGIHKEGHVTPIFDSITEAMRAMGEEDRGKGICTSLKWNQRWKGYMWFYADLD